MTSLLTFETRKTSLFGPEITLGPFLSGLRILDTAAGTVADAANGIVDAGWLSLRVELLSRPRQSLGRIGAESRGRRLYPVLCSTHAGRPALEDPPQPDARRATSRAC